AARRGRQRLAGLAGLRGQLHPLHQGEGRSAGVAGERGGDPRIQHGADQQRGGNVCAAGAGERRAGWRARDFAAAHRRGSRRHERLTNHPDGGMTKRYVSLSYYPGADGTVAEKYRLGMIDNLAALPEIYPGWTAVVWVDYRALRPLREDMRRAGISEQRQPC